MYDNISKCEKIHLPFMISVQLITKIIENKLLLLSSKFTNQAEIQLITK